MKKIISISMSLWLWAGTWSAARGEDFRTDINPALLYYQAFLLEPQLTKAENEYWVSDNEAWPFDQQFCAILAKYNTEMGYLHRAAAQPTPCDWGIDFSPGPATLLPHLGHCKQAARTACLHARWELQKDNAAGARDDLLGALAIGRNSARDGALIGVLVEFAIENIVCATIAENFNHIPPQTLQQLADGFEAGPEQGTVASLLAPGKYTNGHWLQDRIQEFQQAHPNDETAVMGEIQRLIGAIQFEGETNYWPEMTNAAGGTVAGLLRMAEQAEVFDKQLAVILALPHGEFEARLARFSEEVKKSGDFLTAHGLSAWPVSRRREFTVQVELAMVRGAIEYKLHGEAGLQSVSDPVGKGSFTCRRFFLRGEDRGFELQSTYVPVKTPVTMIFVEKDGPPFEVLGVHVGELH